MSLVLVLNNMFWNAPKSEIPKVVPMNKMLSWPVKEREMQLECLKRKDLEIDLLPLTPENYP